MAGFIFLEYTFNPVTQDKEQVHTRLNQLGFIHRSQHKSDKVGFWIQNESIILLRENENHVSEPFISGIGFTVSADFISEDNELEFDQDSNIYYKNLNGTLKLLLLPENYQEGVINNHYVLVDTKKYSTPGLQYFTGVILGDASDEVIAELEAFGFKKNKSSQKYITMISNNRRFSILLDKHVNNKKINAMICDTKDVFRTSACYTVTNVPMRKFNINPKTLDFGSLNHKIIGYNCLATGDQESYTIENFVEEAITGVDLIFRTRKQFLHINEQALQAFYDTEHAATE